MSNISHLCNGSCKNKKKKKEKERENNLTSIILLPVGQRRFFERMASLSGLLWKCPRALKCQVCWGLRLQSDWGRWRAKRHLLTHSSAVSSKQSVSLSFPLNQIRLLGLPLRSLTAILFSICPHPRKPTPGQSGKFHSLFLNHPHCCFYIPSQLVPCLQCPLFLSDWPDPHPHPPSLSTLLQVPFSSLCSLLLDLYAQDLGCLWFHYKSYHVSPPAFKTFRCTLCLQNKHSGTLAWCSLPSGIWPSPTSPASGEQYPRWNQTAWMRTPALPRPGAALGNFFSSLNLSFNNGLLRD